MTRPSTSRKPNLHKRMNTLFVRKARPSTSGSARPRRKDFYVDLDMCGGELFLEDFDLEDFCRVLQTVVPKVHIIPVLDRSQHAQNVDATLVSQTQFETAITKYCCCCSITGCTLPE